MYGHTQETSVDVVHVRQDAQKDGGIRFEKPLRPYQFENMVRGRILPTAWVGRHFGPRKQNSLFPIPA